MMTDVQISGRVTDVSTNRGGADGAGWQVGLLAHTHARVLRFAYAQTQILLCTLETVETFPNLFTAACCVLMLPCFLNAMFPPWQPFYEPPEDIVYK